jgi:hypothetical protein
MNNFHKFFYGTIARKTNCMFDKHGMKNPIFLKAPFELHKWSYCVVMPNTTLCVSLNAVE